MKKLFSIIILAIFLASNAAAENQEKLKVGFVIALTGDAAALGQAMKNGFELGLEKVKPETRAKLDVKFEDDGLNAKNTISAFNKLNSSGGVDVAVSLSSGTSKPLAAVTEPLKVTLLAVASDFNIVKGRNYAFNFWMTPDEATKVLIAEAEKRGYKNIARINAIHDGIIAYKDAFDKQNNGKFNLVLDEDYNPDVKDFKTYITKLRTKKDTQAVLVALLPGQIGVFAKQARQMGYDKPIFGVELFEDQNEVKASNNTLVDQWYVNNDEPDEAFSKLYAERFPGASTYASANGHDLALLLADAIEKGYNKATINQYFKNLKDFKGALGTYSATGDQRFTLPAAIKIVKKDGFEKLYK